MFNVFYLMSLSMFLKPNILFFTGGNSLMPVEIYSNFIEKLNNKFNVIVVSNNKNSDVIEQLLKYTDQECMAVGHSSGCTTLVNYCSKFNNIKKAVLLDPVDNSKNKLEPKFDKVLFINAEKSYQWNFKPFKVPFIPAFAMKRTLFNNSEIINIPDSGHTDILDSLWSNIMHSTLSPGNDDRSKISEYKDYIVNLIYDFYIENEPYFENETVELINQSEEENSLENLKEKLIESLNENTSESLKEKLFETLNENYKQSFDEL